MRATGIVRKIDELGRIVLPKELRDRYRWEVGDPIEVYTENDIIMLKKYDPLPDVEHEIERLVYSLRTDNPTKYADVIKGLEDTLQKFPETLKK